MQHDLPLVFHIDVGESVSLSNSGPENPRYHSSDPSIATIDVEGLLSGVASGNVTVKATDDSGVTSFDITVHPPAADTGVTGPTTHPRIRFTADDLERRRSVVYRDSSPGSHNDMESVAASFFAEADAILEQQTIAYEFEFGGETFAFALCYPPEQPGPKSQPIGFSDYPFWTRLSRQIEDRLTHLCLAFSLSGESRYADKAKLLLLGICNWRKWHEYDKATNNLSLPHFTIAASVAYDELYDVLTESERHRVRSAIVRLGLRPMAYWFDRRLDHNIAVLMNVGMLYGYLAIGDEEPFLEKYLEHSVAALAWYLRQREQSSVTEGLLYTSYAMSTLLDAGLSLRRALGRSDLVESMFIQEELPAFFAYQFAGQGHYANLSDSYADLHPARLLTKLSNELGNPLAGWLLQHEDATRTGLLDVLDRDRPISSFDAAGTPLDRHFERIDWVASRSGWTGDDSVVVFSASPSAAGHNHFDQNHFVLAVHGEWLITDPGYQNYSPGPEAHFTTDSIGHNTLLVNNLGQSVRGHGHIVNTKFSAATAVVTGDATGAYEGRIRQWLRTLVFVRDRYLLIVDDLSAMSCHDELSLLFHSMGTMTSGGTVLPSGPVRQLNDPVTVTGDRSSLDMRMWTESPSTLDHRQYEGAERYGSWLDFGVSGAIAHRVVTLLAWNLASPEFDITRAADATLFVRVGNDEHVVPLPDANGVRVDSSIAGAAD